MTVTAALAEAIAAVRAAGDDPAHRSRWRHVRDRAERRWWAQEERAREIASRYRHELVLEAADRVAPRSQPLRAWHQPDVGAVLEEVRQFGNYVPVGPESVAEVIYRDSTLTLDRDDLALVQAHAAELSDDVFSVVQRRSYTAKPGAHGMGTENDDEVIAALATPHARLPRHVTLYRGEYPNSADPDFARAVHEARPGDVLTQRRRPVSASLDPRVAASSEFTLVFYLAASRILTNGWLLEISTDRALYAGDRAKRSGSSENIADQEKEALIYVPRLRVTGHREALVRCPNGPKRVHVIACTPDEEDTQQLPDEQR